jgi:hypothetical protein
MLVALGFGFAITIFLHSAIFGGQILSPWDLAYQYFPWHAQLPQGWTSPTNPAQADSVVVIEPWLAYGAARLHAGALPLWNPENGLGAPFIGNMQSAVFYPGNWIHFLWPNAALLVVRVWLNMWVAALGMYVLARSVLRVGPMAAAVGATMFTFGGFVTAYALWPHMNVAVWLPWLWWATARLIEAPNFGHMSALAAFAALSLLGGQPEIAYYIALATGLFALFLIATGGPLKPARVARLLGWWTGAYALGVLISAIQLLPFIDYLSHSANLVTRDAQEGGRLWLPLPYLWTAVAPDLLGNPVRGTVWSTTIIPYQATNMYAGLLGLLLAPFAVLARSTRKGLLLAPFVVLARSTRKLAAFLTGLIVLLLCVIYHAPVVYDTITTVVPLMRLALNYRLLLVVELGLALLAALGADAIANSLRRPRRLMVVLGCSVLVLGVAGIAVPWLFAGTWFGLPAIPIEAIATWHDGLVRAGIVLLVCAALVLVIIVLGRVRPRWAPLLLALLPLALWVDLEQARGDFNPTIQPADYAPPTAATTYLQQHAGLDRVAGLGTTLPPDTNLYYGLHDVRLYDAMQPATYWEMAKQLGSTPNLPNGLITKFQALHSPVVDLLNVRYVLAAPGDNPNLLMGAHQELNNAPVGEIAGSNKPGQTFVATDDNLSQVQVLGATYGRVLTGTLVFHLKAAPNAPTDLVTQDLSLAGLSDNTWWPITFPPIRQAAGRTFYFYLESPGARAGNAATLWYNSDDLYAGGTRMDGNRPATGDLAFRTLSFVDPDAPRFTKMVDGGGDAASVFANRDALPRAWLTHAADVITDTALLVQRLSDPKFSAAATVLLSAPLPPTQPLPTAKTSTGADTVTITSYEPETVEISTGSSRPGILVLADQYFSGWQATVDGAPAAILPVDDALRGVYLPAGNHTVRFTYVPLSFWSGAIISIGALLGTLGLLVWNRRRRSRPQIGDI